MTTIRFQIDDMHCGACTGRVERLLTAQPGVSAAQANLAGRSVTISADRPDLAAPLADVLTRAGYPPRLAQTRLEVDGMTCAACSGRVERLLAATPGVTGAQVNLAARRADVTYAEGATSPTELAARITAAGYATHAPVAGEDRPDAAARARAETAALRRAFLIAAALSLPVFLLEMTGHLIPTFHHWIDHSIGLRTSWLIQMALTALVLAGPGRVFFAHGLPALARGAPEMNSLVALGAGAAFVFSTLVVLAPGLLPEGTGAVYFEAAAVIVTLILLGRWLESRARGQAGAAIRRLAGLAPDHASVERGDQVIDLPIAELVPGDRIRIAAGARVPVDAEVISGNSHVDESMLTGEPLPVAKSPGAGLTGGTVNGAGALVARVTATGADTVLARIIALVDQAQGAKLPVQALVDRVTRVFVPVVMALAALTFALWLAFGPEPALSHALVRAISVLIIACPCAMGLATPVSILVGTGRAAELGLLFRRGDALQRLAEVDLIAFDKTGTLTEGRPVVTEVVALDPEALTLAAAIEAQSDHPLARAITAHARGLGLTLPAATGVTAQPGRGIGGQVGDRAVELLAPRLVADLPGPIAKAWAKAGAAGASGVVVLADGLPIGLIALADTPKPGAAPAIAALHRLGVDSAMISGDAQAAAQAIGAGLGIDRVVAEVLPEGKVAALAEVAGGRPAAFVGDGINDAPVLAAADVGIAIGTGTDVAIEAAEVVLMTGDPQGVARAVGLSRAVMRNIRQNLFWAFAYNSLLIPVAMGALEVFGGPGLSPMLAAGAMALSSVFVVTNALRLRRA
ncbi:heavy metal translocating P-type ATPase [Paracoccus sp. p4-l81]|uniref:heavy metal translocating P-type ATPase n=1 Tax=unclassified Paracoccus (in: a-proteobacteria) TaxID=2688777 RepID=UPI0035BAEAB5